MLVRDAKRFLLYGAPAAVFLYLCLGLFNGSLGSPSGLLIQAFFRSSPDDVDKKNLPFYFKPAPESHHELKSVSTSDGKFFPIDFGHGQDGAINPNIIPHPTIDGVWVVVAQAHANIHSPKFDEIVCYAAFNGTLLRCEQPPRVLPIAPTKGLPCDKGFDLLDINEGPHDARVFYGPTSAYAVYGTNSQFTCFGQFIQDFATLMEWSTLPRQRYLKGTEMQKPGRYGQIEKNWFVFWDNHNEMYAHYNVQPRAFARLSEDGSVGEDLGPSAAAKGDTACLKRYMPKLAPEDESIHQATNSLSITLCRRADPNCLPSDSNTIAFTLFHHKKFYDYHSVYEPYVMAFSQVAPFQLYGMSRKPIWIHGRGVREDGETEMLYAVSMSWKARSQRYHGYIDDTLYIAFGIEDRAMGGIDVLANNLLGDLGLCSEP